MPGFSLSLGFTLLYLTTLVLVPLLALVIRPWSLGLDGFWDAMTAPRVPAALRLSLGTAIATSAILNVRMPGAAAILWNANNTYGFGSIDFSLLRLAASITTVSRFMRAEMSAVGVDAAVLPNGIAERFLKPLPPAEARPLREAFGDRPTFVKVARFDPDKRWLWAIDAIAFMRDAGARPRLLMRGSRNPYGDIVGARIRARGLSIERVALPTEAATRDLAAVVAASTAEILFLDYFIPERTLRAMYQAADGVLANSEKEPFGLVGLEVMASGGLAYVGRTGEDYAVPFGNAVVMQSDDPRELLATHATLGTRPEVLRAIRADGKATAKRFAWPRVLDGYEAAWETAFALTSG